MGIFIFNTLVDFFASPSFLAVALALMGGMVSILQKSPGCIRSVFANLAASGFGGLILYLFVHGQTYIDDYVKIGLSGLAGYLGIKFLDSISRRIINYRLSNGDGDK